MRDFYTNSTAQDLHFSQYFNSLLLVNPANAGFAPDVDYRVGINYRNQWASVTLILIKQWMYGAMFNYSTTGSRMVG